jgi:hypothetical protein
MSPFARDPPRKDINKRGQVENQVDPGLPKTFISIFPTTAATRPPVRACNPLSFANRDNVARGLRWSSRRKRARTGTGSAAAFPDRRHFRSQKNSYPLTDDTDDDGDDGDDGDDVLRRSRASETRLTLVAK